MGLEDAGFLFEKQVVYTDAFQVRHYVARLSPLIAFKEDVLALK